jgi:hypothetical protein
MSSLEKVLNNINSTSLAKICFYNKQFDEFIKDLDFYNIVFAGDGLYVALKNDFAISIDKISSVKYSNAKLKNFQTESGLYPCIQKPNIDVFTKIIEIFKYMYDKIKSEICVNVYFNKLSHEFHISIGRQLVGGVYADYDYDEEFEMSSDYIRYLQIHSHHTMSAEFSPRDDKDEKLTAPCYYGVVGKLNSSSSFYNIDSKFRIWNGIRFVSISFNDVFNVGIIPPKLSTNDIARLNEIVENSKKEKESKVDTKLLQNLPGFSGNPFGDLFNEHSRML